MKPYLLYSDRDDNTYKSSQTSNELIQDLNLNTIFEVMSQNNSILYDAAKKVLLNSLTDIKTIKYRQEIVQDCISNKSAICSLFEITTNALDEADFYSQYTKPNYARIIPVSVRAINSVGLLEILINKLEELKELSQATGKNFKSPGMTTFYKRLNYFFTDAFFIDSREHISKLKTISEGGKMTIGAKLGNGLKGTDYILREMSNESQKTGSNKIKHWTHSSNEIILNNTTIERNAREVEEGVLIHILRIINHFTDNILGFLESLQHEAGFYVGCVNLYDELSRINSPIAFPVPTSIDTNILNFNGLYDLSLSIIEKKKLVVNNLDADGKSLFIITGANQGGKSTFLRSIGIAQLLMQCGLFVPANHFSSNVCDHIYTHFIRKEDTSMNSGKLDEELSRMAAIVNNITPNSLFLMNESFSTTTERDGSNIATDIVTALYDLNIKALFVTHLFEFSNSFYKNNLADAIFLRAERYNDGDRSFIIKEGQPIQTSYGEDLYNSIIQETNNV